MKMKEIALRRGVPIVLRWLRHCLYLYFLLCSDIIQILSHVLPDELDKRIFMCQCLSHCDTQPEFAIRIFACCLPSEIDSKLLQAIIFRHCRHNFNLVLTLNNDQNKLDLNER